MPKLHPHEKVVQADHIETDPQADSARGLVLFSGPERCILSRPNSPPPQMILEIRLRGSGLSVHGPLCEGRESASHQLLVNANSMSSLPVLPARPDGTPRVNPLGQHVCGVLHKSPRGPFLEGLCLLAEHLLVWTQPHLHSLRAAHIPRKIESRCGQVISEQCPLRGVYTPSADGSENLGDLWQGRGRPLRLSTRLLS